MNSIWKYVATGAVSAVVGYFAASFVEKKKAKKRIRKIEEEFRGELTKRSKQSCNKPDISELLNKKEEKGKAVMDNILKKAEPEEKVVEARKGETVNDMVKKYVEEGVATVKPKHIEVITGNEYDELYDFTSNVLTYYADDFLINEKGKVVANPKQTIGEVAWSMLSSGEKSMVYVKDEDTGAKYEIYYDNNCWFDLEEDDSDVGDFKDSLDE